MIRRKFSEEKEKEDEQLYRLRIHQFTNLRSRGKWPWPKSRRGHRIECTDTYLFLIGGKDGLVYDADDDLISDDADIDEDWYDRGFQEVWKYHLVSRTWSKLRPRGIPAALADCYTVSSGDIIFLYGTGQLNNSSLLYFAKLPTYGVDITFEAIMSNTYPASRFIRCLALKGSYIYAVGGTSESTESMDVHAFNLETTEWTKLYDLSDFDDANDAPKPSCGHGMVCYNERLYIFGGTTGTSLALFSLEELPTFDLKTNRWETIRTIGDVANTADEVFPANRTHHGCVQDPYLPSVVYINGGYRMCELLRDTWRLDLDTLKWTCIRTLDLPGGILLHSVAIIPDGRLHVFGGMTGDITAGRATADLYSAWIRIPKLKDACWDAIEYYYRKGVYAKSVANWLPKKFADRLNVSKHVTSEIRELPKSSFYRSISAGSIYVNN